MATTSVRGRIDTGNIASIVIRAGIPGIPKVVYYVYLIKIPPDIYYKRLLPRFYYITILFRLIDKYNLGKYLGKYR